MMQEFFIPSSGRGQIHCAKWIPDGEIKGIVQIVHGIAEHIARYDAFARYLNTQGFLVVAEDHMGHGKSIAGGSTQGFFHGGWFAAVADTHSLMEKTAAEHPGVPYVIFGHSMGSFMTRTLLCKYSAPKLAGAVICGTGWQPKGILPEGIALSSAVCKKVGEENPSEKLQGFVFGSYNKRVENAKTPFDWLNRDDAEVKAYIDDPFCGFTASSGLLRDMMKGIQYVENASNLKNMDSTLPVLFICGGDDPVGNYGEGVLQTAQAFNKAGLQNITVKVYPKARHEILNEINKDEVFADTAAWLCKTVC